MTESTVQIADARVEPAGTRLVLREAGEEASIVVPAFGPHVEAEALAHVTRRRAAGDTLTQAVGTLQVADAPRQRERREGPHGRIVIDDTVTTTLEGLRPSLQVLAQLGRAGRQTILVLGGLSLDSDDGADPRDELGLLLVRLDIAQLVAIGPELKRLHLSAGREGSWNGESVQVESASEAYDFVRASSEDDAVIVVCGGETPELERLVHRLCEVDA